MAILTNSLLTFSAIGNREDLSNTIFNIDPVETPFMGNIGKNKAEAVLHEPGEGGEPVVSEVLRSGYTWNGRVLRAAMVKVRG